MAFSANNPAMSRSSAELSAAVCGLIRTLGSVHSGLSTASGSEANTSSATNPTRPSRRASISAGSSMTVPRPILTKVNPGFAARRTFASTKPSVAAVRQADNDPVDIARGVG